MAKVTASGIANGGYVGLGMRCRYCGCTWEVEEGDAINKMTVNDDMVLISLQSRTGFKTACPECDSDNGLVAGRVNPLPTPPDNEEDLVQ